MSVRDDLLAERLVTEAPPDTTAASAWLSAAETHLVSAEAVAGGDLAGAYALLYEAAQKAVAAAMLIDGLRVRARPGSHLAVARYALSLERSPEDGPHLARLDEMRRNRNRSQYGNRVFGIQEVTADLDHAREIVSIIKALI